MKRILFTILLFSAFCVACRERNHWPPETSGPNLPVRYCDIQKGDKDKTVIGYALVDTSAVNWLVNIWLEGASVFSPELSDIRKTERILQKEYSSILSKHGWDKQGHLYEEGGLRNYARQYVFMKSPEGRKYVYVNFILLRLADLEDKEPPYYDPDDLDFLPPPPPVRDALSRYWLVVHDGGDGYWRVMVDLDDEVILNCYVNGLA